MKRYLKATFLFTSFIFSATTYAVITPNNHTFVAAIVNRSGQAIRYYTSDTEVATALTQGSAAHLMWEASPNIPIRIEGFIPKGYYVPICDDIKSVNAGQTVTIFTKQSPEKSDDYFCRLLPVQQR